MRRGLLINGGRLALAALILVGWQQGVDHGSLDVFVVSSPLRIWHRLHDWFSGGMIWHTIWVTVKELILGYGMGLSIGVAIGMAIGLSPIMRAYFEPFLVFVNALPRLVLTPIFIALLGFGSMPKILTVFCVIVVTIALTVSTGAREIQGSLIDNARMLGAGRWNVFRDVYLPGVGVWILASARVAIAIAFQAAIVAEFFGASAGLGSVIEVSLTSLDATGVYSAILIAGTLAFMIDLALTRVQRRTAAWLP